MWRNGNPYSWLVGVQTHTPTMEITDKVSQMHKQNSN